MERKGFEFVSSSLRGKDCSSVQHDRKRHHCGAPLRSIQTQPACGVELVVVASGP